MEEAATSFASQPLVGGIQERISAPPRSGRGTRTTLNRAAYARPSVGGAASGLRTGTPPAVGSGSGSSSGGGHGGSSSSSGGSGSGSRAGLTMSAFGGLTADGLIQERMRWPPRTGMEMMRTVASRVTSHTPSHYAMLGVPHDFTDAQLRKQHKLLMIRYHPDAAARNNIDPLEAKERFQALQTAYQVLSDPEKRRRYNLELRLQHRRAWSRAWEGPRMLIVDKSSGHTAEGDADATPPLPHPPPVPRSRLRTGEAPAVPADPPRSPSPPTPLQQPPLPSPAAALPRTPTGVSRHPTPAEEADVSEADAATPGVGVGGALSGAHGRRFVSTPPLLDEPAAAATAGGMPSSAAGSGGGATEAEEAERFARDAERAEKARRWDTERLAWLQKQIEAQEAALQRLPRSAHGSPGGGGGGGAFGGGGASGGGSDTVGGVGVGGAAEEATSLEERLRQAKREEAEARHRAAEAEKALRHAKDRMRRKAQEEKLRREAEAAARAAEVERTQAEEEEAARKVEARVRRQVEERARRQGEAAARREAAEAVREAEERARLATLAAEDKAIRLQAELDRLQRRLEAAEQQASRPAESWGPRRSRAS